LPLSAAEPQTVDNPADPPALVRLSDLLSDWQTDAEAAYQSRETNTPRGPVTGLTRLDRELGNHLAPGLHILHGEPGTGKTALALQVAARCKSPALYLSAEMGALELARRITARATQTYLGRLKSGELPPVRSLELLLEAAKSAPALHLADASRGALASSAWILSTVTDLQQQAGKAPLVVVDSLHSWAETCTPAGYSEYNALNIALSDLRRVAQVAQVPVLCVAERNRATMKQGGLSAAAGTRKFEYGAESVWSLKREEDTPIEEEYAVTLTLSKNRGGSPGAKVALLFHGALQQFREDPGAGV